MKKLRSFLESIWQLMPDAQLASEYHPAVEGGALLIPFIQSQKQLDNTHTCNEDVTTPQLTAPNRTFASYMQGYSSLPLRDRALIALRSAYLCNAKHLIADIGMCAQDTGYTHTDIRMIAVGHLASGWTRREKLLLKATDSLYKKQTISRPVWRALMRTYTSQQLLDLIFCAAAFHLCVYPN